MVPDKNGKKNGDDQKLKEDHKGKKDHQGMHAVNKKTKMNAAAKAMVQKPRGRRAGKGEYKKPVGSKEGGAKKRCGPANSNEGSEGTIKKKMHCATWQINKCVRFMLK